jgi:CubicO group peptidase (beta-lactamase class C family)
MAHKHLGGIFRIAACVVLLAMMLWRDVYPTTAQDLNNKTISDIDAFIADKMHELNIPGMALGIVHGDQIAYLKGYGIADPSGRAITPQTPFLMASISKSFTGVAVMQLVEAGKIDLNAPVKQYIPWFRPQDTEHPITVSELLYHTSGFSIDTGRVNLNDADTSDTALENEVRRLSAEPLDRPAGKTFEYTNAGYNIAGYLVQVTSGQSYEDYIQEHILIPLDMHHSFLSFDKALTDGKALGYYPFFGNPIVYDVPYSRSSTPSAGILSSAEDMAHYLIAHLNEGHYKDASILSAEGIAKLHTPGSEINHWVGYAMGWNVLPLWDTSATTADGQNVSVPITLQHEGLSEHRTNMLLVPKEKWGVVTLVDTSDFAIQSAFNSIGWGVTVLLMGYKPPPTGISEDLLTQNGRSISIVLVLVQVLRLIGSVLNLRRWRRDPESRPRGALLLAQYVVLPALIDLALALWILVAVPQQEHVTVLVAIRANPDLGLLIIVVLVLAVGWGILRTILYIRALRRKTAPSVVSVAAAA